MLARIDALSLRERVMVLGAVLALAGFVGDTLLLAPQRARLVQIERDAARERSELAAVERQVAELGRQLVADPDEVPRLRLQQLSAELAKLNAEFERVGRSLVPPEQMAPLLEQVLRRTPGVSVARLQTLAPQPLPEREPGGGAQAGQSAQLSESGRTAGAPADGTRHHGTQSTGDAQPALWRHGAELTVRGSYADLLRYLTSLERLPVRIYFGRAVLDAAKYPELDLRLTVYTLGIDKSWLAL
jgi:MSHA biogenesis protein MshJ